MWKQLTEGIKLGFCILCMVVMGQSSWAQAPAMITPFVPNLSIGDHVPNVEFQIVNYRSSTAKLSDFRGKLVILDFWATWCTACISHFPKVDSLQEKFGDQIRTLLVNTKSTGDNLAKVTRFFERTQKPDRSRYDMPSVVNDSILDVLFKHRSIPHYVWIDKDGKLLAITSSEFVNAANIEKALKGEKLNLPQKKDDFNYEKPLFVDGNGGEGKYINRSLLVGYTEGLPSVKDVIVDEAGKVSRIYCTNLSIVDIYGHAYNEMYKYPRSRVILDVKDPGKYRYTTDWDNWKHDHLYSYELIIPPTTKQLARQAMRDDLKRYFGLEVRMEKRVVKCLVLKYDGKSKKAFYKTGADSSNIFEDTYDRKFLHNYPVSHLVDYFNTQLGISMIDESGINKNVTMELTKDLSDTALLKKTLQPYGFDLVEEDREIDLFILAEKK